MEQDYVIVRITEKSFVIENNYKDFFEKIRNGKETGGYHSYCSLITKNNNERTTVVITTDLKFIDNNEKEYLSCEFATEFVLLNESVIRSGVSNESFNLMAQFYLIAQSNAHGILANRLTKSKLPFAPIQIPPFSTYHETITQFLRSYSNH